MTRHAIAALLLLAPALLAGQSSTTGGFEPDHLFVGPRTWLGVDGTASIGGHVEVPVSKRGAYGPGLVGIGASAAVYRYSPRSDPTERRTGRRPAQTEAIRSPGPRRTGPRWPRL